jgi:hypothetical protein
LSQADHLLHHGATDLSPYAAGVLRFQIAVITGAERDSQGSGDFIFHILRLNRINRIAFVSHNLCFEGFNARCGNRVGVMAVSSTRHKLRHPDLIYLLGLAFDVTG